MAKTQFDILFEQIAEMAYGQGANASSISLDQFEHMIIDFDASGVGTRPISFTSVTSPKYRKTGFPYQSLYKVGQTNGMIGFDYEANVNAQREREGQPTDFKKQQMSNIAEWVSDSVGITTTGLKVLIYRPLQAAPSYWVAMQNGQPIEIPGEEAKTYLVGGGAPTNQGVEKPIPYRTYGFDKIVSVNFQKNEYNISDVDPTRKAIFDVVKDHLRS